MVSQKLNELNRRSTVKTVCSMSCNPAFRQRLSRSSARDASERGGRVLNGKAAQHPEDGFRWHATAKDVPYIGPNRPIGAGDALHFRDTDFRLRTKKMTSAITAMSKASSS